MDDAKKQYEAFATELKRRFEEAYKDAKPPIQAVIEPIGGENVEVRVRVIDRSFVELPVLVSFMAPNAIEVAWEILDGAAERAIAESRAR